MAYRIDVGQQDRPSMPYGFQLANVIHNEGSDTQAIAGHPKSYRQPADRRVLILAFRGTEPLKFRDWLTDANHQVVPYDGTNPAIGVHAGFIAAYKSVREALHKLVEQYEPEAVYTSGHSLGGALAGLSALDLRKNFPDLDVICYTYGAPMIGNESFVESYHRYVFKTFAFVYRYDIVPHLPFRRDGYEYTAPLCYLRPASFKMLRIVLGVPDHNRKNYIRALEKRGAKDECC
jgi:predicted lipase